MTRFLIWIGSIHGLLTGRIQHFILPFLKKAMLGRL